MENKISTQYMMKIKNLRKRENKQLLLKEAGFKNIQDAKKALGMSGVKANTVYEELMEHHNKQVDEIRKNVRTQTSKINYDIGKDIKRVKQFNENGKELTIGNLHPKKLQKIIKSIDTTKRTILTVNNRHYTLTAENQKKLLDEDFFLNKTTSGSYNHDILYEMTHVKSVQLSRPKWIGKNKNEGAFFKYYHNTSLNLDEFAVHQTKQEKYNENCFVQALISLGVDDSIITEVRKIICSKYLPTNKLTAIAEKFNLYIRVKTLDAHKETLNFGKKGNKEILLGLIDQHYFAVKKVDWTSYAVKNYFDICNEDGFEMMYPNGNRIRKDVSGNRCTTSWETIKYMYENQERYLTQIPYEHLLDTQYYKEAKEITNLETIPDNFRENKVPEKNEEERHIVFFDFETITNEEIHKPYMVCNSETEIEYGEDCGHKMLKKLYQKFHTTDNKATIILVAHNAGYDFRFIQQYIHIQSIIERGHTVMEVKGKFYACKGKSINIVLKDSYSIITMPLKKFGKCFGLSQAKEILPYNLYTTKNIKAQFLPLQECRDACDIQVRCDNLDRNVDEKDYEDYFKLFVENASKWDCMKDGLIDIVKYSKVYCEMDVEVLKQGYNKFGEMLKESCNMRIEDFISSAQLAH